jgi:serine O-acetyltransferase
VARFATAWQVRFSGHVISFRGWYSTVIMDGAVGSGRTQRLHEWYRRTRYRVSEPLARLALSSTAGDIVRADLEKWHKYGAVPTSIPPGDENQVTAALIALYPEFRTLLYHRLSHHAQSWVATLVPVLKRIWHPHPTLRFFPRFLGPGCFILHGFASGISAKSIGAGFVVGPQVIIGYKSVDQLATIGDNVTIYAGAIIIGNITIGDDAVIGAGAVVVRDVSPGATVVGEAARELPRKEET